MESEQINRKRWKSHYHGTYIIPDLKNPVTNGKDSEIFNQKTDFLVKRSLKKGDVILGLSERSFRHS